MNMKSALRRARQRRGWSQAKVAEAIGADSGTVSRWERGISIPSPYFREQLCRLFEMDTQALGFVQSSEDEQEEFSLLLKEGVSLALPLAKKSSIIDPVIPRLPSTSPSIIGHKELLNDFILTVCTGGTSALFGLPGVGKTTLLIALVHDKRIRAHFADGILWAELGPKPDVYTLLLRWSMLLGMPASVIEKQTVESLATILQRTLEQGRFLIVLDDVWAVEAIQPLLPDGSHCAQIVTTRFPQLAHIVATHIAIPVPVLNGDESFELLTTMVPELLQIEKSLTRSVIQLVGGLPLVLTLIGKHLQIVMRSGQPRRLYSTLSRFKERSTRLQLPRPFFEAADPARASKSRISTIEEKIALSDRFLSSSARSALESLSLLPVQPSSFSEAAALAVAATSVDVLDELVDKGMIESHSPGRYMIHQLILDYSLERNEPSIEARKRLIDYGIGYVELYHADLISLEVEADVIFHALEQAHYLEYLEELIRGVCALINFFCTCRLYDVAKHHLSRASMAASKLGNPGYKVQVLFYQGEIAHHQNNYMQAFQVYKEALSIAEQIGDDEWRGRILYCLGTLMRVRGEYTQALPFLQEGELLARKLNNRGLLCNILIDCFFINLWLGRFKVLEALGKEILSLLPEQQTSIQETPMLLSLSWVFFEQGDYQAAESYAQKALYMSEQGEDVLSISDALIRLGRCSVVKGEQERARSFFQKASSLLYAQTFYSNVSVPWLDLMRLAMELRDYKTAESILQQIYDTVRGPHKLSALWVAMERGELYFQQGKLNEAKKSWNEVLALSPQEAEYLIAQTCYGLARVAASQRNDVKSTWLGKKSFELFKRVGHRRKGEVEQWLRG